MKGKWILAVVIALAALSCSKEVKKSDIEDVRGDYEWFYSTDDLFESVYSDAISDQHGIRIKSKRKVEFYTNSEKELSLDILSVHEYGSDGKLIVVRWNDQVNRDLVITDDVITFYGWPYSEFSNRFVKSK